MGRRKAPIEQKIKNGTYRPCRDGPLPSAMPVESGDLAVGDTANAVPLVKPADLTGDAAAMWEKMSRTLAGVVKERDAVYLVEMCRWWAELRRVQAVLSKTTPGAKGYNQLLIGAGICADKFDKLGSRFGLTPSDRAKLRAEVATVQKAKVATRPRTKLDQQGPPK